MYEYDFVMAPIGYLKKMQADRSAYRELIHERARLGWRLVQIFHFQPATMTAEVELIFERPITSVN